VPALLSVFGELERLMSEEFYPYRYVLTPLIGIALAGAVFLAVRHGLHLVVWRHRLASTLIGVPLLVGAVFAGNYLLSPLWERSFLEEEGPVAMVREAPASAGGDVAMTTAVFAPRTASRGMFMGADDFHFGRGDALIIEAEAGKHVLRLENFSVRNGPDLYVYLSHDPDGEIVEERLNLGKLKATDGSFNYDIPVGIDISQVRSVVVWCKAFSVQFAAAAFMPST
jgi:hypothetical protein